MSKPDDSNPELELDEEPTEAELAEAAALARALDRGSLRGDTPDDALEAAALLRLGNEPLLQPTRKQEIWQELERHLSARGARGTSSAGRLLRWLWVLVPAAGVAAVTVYLSRDEHTPTGAMSAAFDVPRPSRALLEAQARLLSGQNPADVDHFQTEMSEYREQVYASLEARYR